MYVITNLKINNFMGKSQKDNLIAILLSLANLDEHVSVKINTFRIYKGVWGGGGLAPQMQKKFLKNQTKWRLFLIVFFFAFWQGSLYPQNYELAP